MATTAPSVPAKAAPPRGWFRCNWKWFIPASILTAALVALIVAAGVIGVRVNRYKSSTPYQTALAIVQESPQVQARLGAPIKDVSWVPSGQIEVSNYGGSGTAAFNFTVSGPKGTAVVQTEARMVEAEWNVNDLFVRFPDDERLNLRDELAAKQNVDTPAFDPEKEKQRKTETKSDEPPLEINVDVGGSDEPK
jgi:Cytochrome oxidase complex assembly protein 1